MNFSKENIFFQAEGNTKEDLLRFISQQAKILNISDDSEGLCKDLLKREQEFSTGLQDGFAIPHARSHFVKEPSILLLKTANELDWETFDGGKVNCLFSLLVPFENQGNVHLQMLSTLATCLMEEDFREKVKNCEDKEELINFIYHNMKEETK